MRPVADASGQNPHQFNVRDLAEVVRQIPVDHLVVTPVQEPMNPLDRIQRASFRPVAVLFRLQVRLENRCQRAGRRGENC